MKSLCSLLLVGLFFASCAGRPPAPQQPSEKDFEVPTKLADQFAVKEQTAGIPVAAPEQEKREALVSTPDKQEPKAVGKKTERKVKQEKVKAEGSVGGGKKHVVPNRWTMEPFFRAGEHYAFDITYFGATAGVLELDTLPNKIIANRPTFHFRASARTSSVFSLFYRLNDVAESFVDVEGLMPHKFSIKLDESLQQRDVLELYDQQKHKVYYWSKLDHKKKGKRNDQAEIEVPPFTQDSVSAFFYVRTLPLKVGEVYEFPLSTNGKLKSVRVTVIEKEKITTKIGALPAIKVKPEVVLDGVLTSYGDTFVWISDDANRTLLKVDAKIKVGSIIAYLREYNYGPSGNEKSTPSQ